MKLKIISLITITLLIIQISALSENSCTKYSGNISEPDKILIVKTHNEFRNQIATRTYTVEPNAFDYATNIIQMYWNQELAEKAQKLANKCITSHSRLKTRKFSKYYAGEIFDSDVSDKQDWKSIIGKWFSEIISFRNYHKNIDSFITSESSSERFSQMIWAYSYWIGCGYNYNKNEKKSYYVCLYGPIGNVVGKSVFRHSSQQICQCPGGLKCRNKDFPGLCCPKGHCTSKTLTYNGSPIEGTIPRI